MWCFPVFHKHLIYFKRNKCVPPVSAPWQAHGAGRLLSDNHRLGSARRIRNPTEGRWSWPFCRSAEWGFRWAGKQTERSERRWRYTFESSGVLLISSLISRLIDPWIELFGSFFCFRTQSIISLSVCVLNFSFTWMVAYQSYCVWLLYLPSEYQLIIIFSR